jgi:hypothetical protein
MRGELHVAELGSLVGISEGGNQFLVTKTRQIFIEWVLYMDSCSPRSYIRVKVEMQYTLLLNIRSQGFVVRSKRFSSFLLPIPAVFPVSFCAVATRKQLRLITTALGWLPRLSLDKPPVLHVC